MTKRFWDISVIDETTAEILVYGYISDDEISAAGFVSELKNLEKNHPNINVRINSGGGSVYEGIAIFNAIKNSPSNITIFIDGLAASMASVIAMAGKIIKMSKYARLMFHKPGGMAAGSAEELRQMAGQLDSLEATLIDMCTKRTGLSKDQVKAKYFLDNTDVWLTAEQALMEGLIDEIYDGEFVAVPVSLKPDAKTLWEYYNSINNNNIYMKKVAIYCKLNEAATEDQIIQYIEGIVAKEKSRNAQLVDVTAKLEAANAKITEFEAKEKEAAKQRVKDLVDGAISAKKITEDLRTHYTALAEVNYDATKAILDKMQGYVSIATQVAKSNQAAAETAKWSFTDWQKKDPKGLAEMKKTDFTSFKELFKKEFGKEPKE